LKDVQYDKAEHLIKLSRVGILNLEYPVTIRRPDREHEAIIEMKMSVDLPAGQKGAHLSRFLEEIEESFSLPQETAAIENLAEKIALAQLESHEYAENAVVELRAKRNHNKKVYELRGSYDTNTGRKMVGVDVLGAIACPCSIELTEGLSHNQRAIISLELETNGIEVNAEDLIEICEGAFSAPVQLTLKRPKERELVKMMHANPRFVEDVVRKCVHELRRKYRGRYSRVKCIAQESIHPFDVFAEWSGEL
jgi:GTP cyclohydrolase FolE2